MFDLVFSEGVLHHTPDTRRAFRTLVDLLAPGGQIAFYVYRRKAPLREFADDYVRALGRQYPLGPDTSDHPRPMLAIADYGLPAHVVDMGCKGCISYRTAPLTNYRDFLETNADIFDASWAWLVNRGIFWTPGNEEQWTLSVQHDEAHIDRFVEAFAQFCAALGS